MKLLKVDRLEEARAKLFAAAGAELRQTTTAGLMAAPGRILAEDVRAAAPVPEFRRSTVDGYAVKSADTGAANESIPAFLQVIGEVFLGKPCEYEVKSGTCVYVPTGGMIPDGADAMVMVEYCESFSEDEIAVYTSVAVGAGIVEIGEDMQAGELILTAGRKLRPQDIGALAAAGVTGVKVYRPWKLAVISTGDELVPPEEKPMPGQVRDINTYGICSQAVQAGLEIVEWAVLADEKDLLREKIRQARAKCDVVIVSGGSSQGKKDASAEIIAEVTGGELLTHGLALKPGKPTIIGYDGQESTVIVGLPGHPAAAMLVFELLVLWLWRRVTGQKGGVSVEEGAGSVSAEEQTAGVSAEEETGVSVVLNAEGGFAAEHTDRVSASGHAEGVPVTEQFGSMSVMGRMTTNLASAPGRLTCQLVSVERSGGKLSGLPGNMEKYSKMQASGLSVSAGNDVKEKLIEFSQDMVNVENSTGKILENNEKSAEYLVTPILGKSGMITTLTKADGYIIMKENQEGLRKGDLVEVYLWE